MNGILASAEFRLAIVYIEDGIAFNKHFAGTSENTKDILHRPWEARMTIKLETYFSFQRNDYLPELLDRSRKPQVS